MFDIFASCTVVVQLALHFFTLGVALLFIYLFYLFVRRLILKCYI